MVIYEWINNEFYIINTTTKEIFKGCIVEEIENE